MTAFSFVEMPSNVIAGGRALPRYRPFRVEEGNFGSQQHHPSVAKRSQTVLTCQHSSMWSRQDLKPRPYNSTGCCRWTSGLSSGGRLEAKKATFANWLLICLQFSSIAWTHFAKLCSLCQNSTQKQIRHNIEKYSIHIYVKLKLYRKLTILCQNVTLMTKWCIIGIHFQISSSTLVYFI